MAASHVFLPAPLVRIVLGSLILFWASMSPGCGGDAAEPGGASGGETIVAPKAGSSDTDEKPTEPSGAPEPRPAPPPEAEGGPATAPKPDGLAGRVTRADRGDPAGVLVELREEGKTVATATSGADGRFAFDRIPVGAFAVVATLRGFQPHGVDRSAGATEPVSITLRPGQFVGGRVVGFGGKPVPAFSVCGFRKRPDGAIQNAVSANITDDDGRFRVAGFLPGEWWIEIRAKGFAVWLGRAQVKQGEVTADVKARLRRPSRIGGYVLDEATGDPIARARVLLRRLGVPGLPGAYVTQDTITDDDGYFLAGDLPRDGYAVQVQSAILLEGPPVRVGYPGACPCALFVRRGATIAGRVWDDRGEPVANRRVRLRGPAPRDVFTGRAGRFGFPGLEAGRYRLSADGVTEDVIVQPGFAFRCDLITGPKAACEGVITAAGEPHADCRVRIEGDANEPSWWGSSDAEGRFAFGSLSPGRRRVVVLNRWGHMVYERHHDFVAGETLEIECRLPDGRVEGLVEASLTARPLPGTRVALVPQETLGSRRRPLPHYGAQNLVVERDGLFRFDRIPPGRFVLLAWKEGYATARLDEVVVGRDSKIGPLRVMLSGGGVLRGGVRVGVSAAAALVRLCDERGHPIGSTSTVTRTRDGDFMFRGLDPGIYTLRVHRLGCYERVQRVTVRPGGNPKLRIVLDQLPTRSSQRATGVVNSPNAVGR